MSAGSGDPASRPRAPASAPDAAEGAAAEALSERQALVLRALVSAYVAEAGPVASETLRVLMPVALSSASVRNTLGELDARGLVEKPHRSAGRVPTEQGLRLYLDRLLGPGRLGPWERRELAGALEESGGDVVRGASELLSERTRQLGFVVAPRLDRLVLRHVTLVRLSADRVLAVLVSSAGTVYQRAIEEPGEGDQRELERLAQMLNERAAGRTLAEVRRLLEAEAGALRSRAHRLAQRALRLGALVDAPEVAEGDLVIASRRALLEQPELRDPERIRQLFEAVEAKERVLEMLDRVLRDRGVRVTLGAEMADPDLRSFALVTAPYGDAGHPLGVLGVIGPSRMNYARVIPFVDCLSRLVTEQLCSER